MKKFLIDLTVSAVEQLNSRYVLLRLSDDKPLPNMEPGQFVEVGIADSPATLLRRPISIHFVDTAHNELHLLVAMVGEGTRRLGRLVPGDRLSCLLPLGHGFSGANADDSVLLVGGGVGVAPLLFQGERLQAAGCAVTFLLGGRTAADLLLTDRFARFGRVLTTTEDGSAGERGFVTNHSVLTTEHFTLIQTCGPTPMMKAVAAYAQRVGTACEVSLENLMACGLGACLCCVEKTKEGNLCVCKEGPVFNVNRLLWQF
mgnify:CR=1 FL=1